MKQRELLKQQCKSLKEEVETSKNIQYKLFVSKYSINEEITLINYMRKCIRYMKQMKVNKIKYKINDIRRFIINKRKSKCKGNRKEVSNNKNYYKSK